MKKISKYAYYLKSHSTKAEAILRKALRREKLSVSRQKVLGYYIFDFFMPKIKILIEVDGCYHNLPMQIMKDRKKEDFALRCGYHLFRVKNREIEEDVKGVVLKILSFCNKYGKRRNRFFTKKYIKQVEETDIRV